MTFGFNEKKACAPPAFSLEFLIFIPQPPAAGSGDLPHGCHENDVYYPEPLIILPFPVPFAMRELCSSQGLLLHPGA